jgi:hypothetical protein
MNPKLDGIDGSRETISTMLSPAAPLPARVTPPDGRPSTLGVVRRLLRNSIELWPAETYERPLLRHRLFGRDILFVMDPDLIQQILVDQADAFEKADTMRRALSPAPAASSTSPTR